MIKWNEVTWYSRLGAIILFVGIIPALCFYIGMRYQEQKGRSTIDTLAGRIFTVKDSAAKELSSKLSALIAQETGISSAKKSPNQTYVPKPIDLATLAGYGSTKTYTSPDGRYIAHSYSNEQGESGIYISDLSNNNLSKTYCGFFSEWASDSKKIKIFVPPECGEGLYNDFYFYLSIAGDIEVISK